MLTVVMNNPKPPGCTEPTVFGPFFVEGAPAVSAGGDIAPGGEYRLDYDFVLEAHKE